MTDDPTRIAQATSGRRLTTNSLNLLIGYGVGRAAAFLFVVVLARFLDIADLAIVILAQTVALYVAMLLDFGVTIAAIRLVALEHLRLSTIVSTVLTIRSALATVLIAVGAVGFLLLGSSLDTRAGVVVALFVLGAVIATSDVSWAAQGLGRTKPRGVVIAVSALVQLAVAFLALQLGLGIDAAGIGVVAGAAVGVALGLLMVAPLITWPSRPTLADAGVITRAAIPLGTASLLTQIYYSFDIFLLSATRPPQEVAIYGALYKVPSVFTTISWAICVASLPGLTLAFGEGMTSVRVSVERNIRALIALATPILVVLAVEAPTVISALFGPEFLAGAAALRVLLGSVGLAFVSGMLLYGLAASGRLRVFSLAAAAGAVLNVVFDLVMVPRLGMDAAAWGTVVAEAGVLAVACLSGRELITERLLRFGGGVAVAGLLAVFVGMLVEPGSPLAAAVISICLYGGLAALLRVWDPVHGVVVMRCRQALRRHARIDGT